ncbi:hypothetical protein C8R43DRAFT_1137063 [Mycena crocata]|nr:hypothetical protein C8R43DRAFT_1137063 [Mycena crocata]
MPEPQCKSLHRQNSDSNLKDHGLPDRRAPWSAPGSTTWDYEFPNNPPPLAPPVMEKRNTPSPEIPYLPSDWWHSDTNITIVNGTGNMWSGDRIPFFPDHGYCTTGISMKQARLGTGMLHAHQPISNFLHRLIFYIPYPMLSIQWPGYSSIDGERGLHPLDIHRPLNFHPEVTLVDLAKQVADYLFEFCELYGDNCNVRDPKAILLGRGGVEFNRLRLVKLWTGNGGLQWNAEVAIVDDYIQRFDGCRPFL